jgi:hypothetical protein
MLCFVPFAACESVAPHAAMMPDTLAAGEVPAPPEPPALRTVATERVIGRSGPGGEPFSVALRTAGDAAVRRTGMKDFPIAMRTAPLDKYPCSSCHIPGGTVIRAERIADAHQNIQPVHPAETGARCATCHDARDMERLALGDGETATLDHAYRLCAQCHFAQVDAWAGGAHGKRVDGWRGRRVVLGCAECHDPHRPAIETRIPFKAPRLPRPGEREP